VSRKRAVTGSSLLPVTDPRPFPTRSSAGFLIFIAACVGFSQLRPGPSGAKLAWGMSALVGVGFGAPLALLLTVAQLAVDADLNALATAHIIGIRSFGAIRRLFSCSASVAIF
jgi:hypothetical protein